MTPERQARVEALYKAALGMPPIERDAFIAQTCGSDEALRHELEARLGQTVEDQDDTRSAQLNDPPREWGDLEILAELGAGGFGKVYRAHDRTLARDVALKVIALQRDEDAAAVLREGQMLARIRHRNVVTVHSAQRVADQVGVTMELVEGQNLAELVRENGPMGAEESAVIGLSLCQALAAVHAAGLVHRDVKARNVMRERGGRIVLMDFGLGLDIDSAFG
ncbi:MAG: serine/threonine-protein kinase, partial [Vicinamibacterales bacterium]